MTEAAESHNILEYLDSIFYRFGTLLILTIIFGYLAQYVSENIDQRFTNIILSTIAAAATIYAIFLPKQHKDIDYIEKCLYSFYYPLADCITRNSINGTELDKKEIEQIALYRRLARKTVRDKFEICRNANYKKEDCANLLPYVEFDIDYYEQKLEKLK